MLLSRRFRADRRISLVIVLWGTFTATHSMGLTPPTVTVVAVDKHRLGAGRQGALAIKARGSLTGSGHGSVIAGTREAHKQTVDELTARRERSRNGWASHIMHKEIALGAP